MHKCSLSLSAKRQDQHASQICADCRQAVQSSVCHNRLEADNWSCGWPMVLVDTEALAYNAA